MSGPGQKRDVSFSADGVSWDATMLTMPVSAIWTMSGLSPGRPFAENIFWTAMSLNALPPSPYTVSVGKATTSLSARSLAAGARIDFSSSGVELVGTVHRADLKAILRTLKSICYCVAKDNIRKDPHANSAAGK